MAPDNTGDPVLTYREFLARTSGPIALYLIDDRPDHPQTVSWLIKIDRSSINTLGPTPHITFRLGALQVKHVLVLVILIRIADIETICESWINAHNPSQDGHRVIHELQEQTSITVHLSTNRQKNNAPYALTIHRVSSSNSVLR